MIGRSDRFVPGMANADGRHAKPPVSSPTLWPDFPWLALICTGVAVVLPAAMLTSPSMIAFTCAILFVGGLPHGALDLALIYRHGAYRVAPLIGLYLGLAAVMVMLWLMQPTIALAMFIAIAVAHFAEDWPDCEHPFFAVGIAVALLAAPTVLHHDSVAGLFVLLAGQMWAADLADALLLVAPLGIACALLAIGLLWHRRRWAAAVNAACALAAMILLPPITGFAIYFCLIHSPTHVRAGLGQLASTTGVSRHVAIATLGGVTIALVASRFLDATNLIASLFEASFMTLSILTVPHMAMPLLLRLLGVSARR